MVTKTFTVFYSENTHKGWIYSVHNAANSLFHQQIFFPVALCMYVCVGLFIVYPQQKGCALSLFSGMWESGKLTAPLFPSFSIY